MRHLWTFALVTVCLLLAADVCMAATTNAAPATTKKAGTGGGGGGGGASTVQFSAHVAAIASVVFAVARLW